MRIRAHANLGFHHGAALAAAGADPEGLLAGTGKGLRHVKLRSMAELEAKRAALRALVRAAARERTA